MTDKETQMDEKYFDLQYKLIETKLAGISSTLDSFVKDIKKIIDDHELRLREQAKADAANAQEIVAIRLELKDLRQENSNLRVEATKRLDEITNERKESTKKELSLWQTIGVEAIKYAAFGAGGGGMLFAVLKALGAGL